MTNKNIIIIVIAILVVILACVGSAMYLNSNANNQNNTQTNDTNATNNNTSVDNKTGNNSPVLNNTNQSGNNTTYKVYNPQSDSYVTVIGEKFDDEVKRWYTYDKDGVRYYNTRIK